MTLRLPVIAPECTTDDDAECWLCPCGNYIEDGLHCKCGRQPPWGCPCSGCQNPEPDEDDEDFWGFYDAYDA